jgi:hypothetical protein
VDSLQFLYFLPARLFRESRRNALQIKAALAGNRWASPHFGKFSLQIGKLQGETWQPGRYRSLTIHAVPH